MKLSDRELGTVLAALRHWQVTGFQDQDEGYSDLGEILGPNPLHDDEIDGLCERLNYEAS